MLDVQSTLRQRLEPIWLYWAATGLRVVMEISGLLGILRLLSAANDSLVSLTYILGLLSSCPCSYFIIVQHARPLDVQTYVWYLTSD
ncbi:hypothetical protein V1517DRAFT_315790 [Lipomyces orientalis]|uniref:Uncharacterized protein n=1 Tax=Lipomyces orientalis TaxID=1233043 RepID=A0ACC3TUV7_9ASCO